MHHRGFGLLWLLLLVPCVLAPSHHCLVMYGRVLLSESSVPNESVISHRIWTTSVARMITTRTEQSSQSTALGSRSYLSCDHCNVTNNKPFLRSHSPYKGAISARMLFKSSSERPSLSDSSPFPSLIEPFSVSLSYSSITS